ncbi:WD40/YVTN/BNR-like repeat-containing protein [Pseudomonas citronellolis]|uniref:WD40/YVTN/BNR-like repeat-containing protein n=1 Tax=Pseudomonas citronellolis TaxID=53408 RepID=UPI000778957F|nr:photosystem II stability/assembly factor-like protein [Pseudomonas citronellolis]AMO76003.1 Ycf48-like protein precursor [Pseudomonas citronellolis]
MNRKNPGFACVLVLGLLGWVAQVSFATNNPVNRDVADTLQQKSTASALASRSALNAVALAGERLVVAGVRGHILYSDDQGGHWKQASVPVSVSLTGLCFADALNGWAVGHRGVILATRDGGQSWTRQLDGFRAAQAILDAYRSDPERAEEARRLVDEGADKPFLAVQCLGGSRVLAVGAYGLAFASDDSGVHWQLARELQDGSNGRHLNAVERLHGHLFLAGELGGLMRVNDDLHNFVRLDEPYDGSFFGLLASNAGTLFAFGLRGHLFRSEDQGGSWQQVALPTTKSLTAGARLKDGSLLLADESGQGWLSRDDGRSFQAVSPEQRFPLVALLATTDGGSLAVGSNGITRFSPSALRQAGR